MPSSSKKDTSNKASNCSAEEHEIAAAVNDDESRNAIVGEANEGDELDASSLPEGNSNGPTLTRYEKRRLRQKNFHREKRWRK